MNPRSRQILLFSISCVLTGTAWSLAWPKRKGHLPPAEVSTPEPVKPERWTKARTEEIVTALGAATTDPERLAAAVRASGIPATDFAEALELAELIHDGKLTFTAKALLIRWAEKDGGAALSWSWQRFRAEGVWDQAFREIMASWAARAPMNVADWAILHHDSKSTGAGVIRMKDALGQDSPILDSRGLDLVSNWLVREDPHAAFLVRRARGGFSSHDSKLADSLHSADQIHHAMLAFKDLDPKAIADSKFEGDEIALIPLLSRWQKIAPEDYAKSPYAERQAGSSGAPAPEVPKDWKAIGKTDRITVANSTLAQSPPVEKFLKIQEIAKLWGEVDAAATYDWLDSLPALHDEVRLATYAQVMAPRDLDGFMKRADGLPLLDRSSVIVQAFDSWQKAHPGESPDKSGWSAGSLEIWEDMEALRPRVTD